MSKVWIVTSGSYSDYSVERVFTTKAQAEWWINRDPYYGIEEFDLDDVSDRCEPCVDVQLVLGTGDVASACTRPGWVGCQREVVVRHDLVGRVVLQVSVRTGDTLDAVKVASEKRAQLIAQSHGLPGLGYYDRDTLTKLR